MSSIFDGMAEIFANTFGDTVRYTRASSPGSPLDIQAIFRREPVDVVLGADPAHNGVRVTLALQAVDVPLPVEGDTVLADGATWKVVPPIQNDGRGTIKVLLEATA